METCTGSAPFYGNVSGDYTAATTPDTLLQVDSFRVMLGPLSMTAAVIALEAVILQRIAKRSGGAASARPGAQRKQRPARDPPVRAPVPTSRSDRRVTPLCLGPVRGRSPLAGGVPDRAGGASACDMNLCEYGP